MLLACAAFGQSVAYWSAVPVNAGTLVALERLSVRIRRAKIADMADTPGGGAPVQV